MTKKELIKEVIKLTLFQVWSQGWDLLDVYDENTDKGVNMVYDKIKDEL